MDFLDSIVTFISAVILVLIILGVIALIGIAVALKYLLLLFLIWVLIQVAWIWIKRGYMKLTGREFSCKIPILDSYVKSDDVIEYCKNGIRLTENGKRLLKGFDTENFINDHAWKIFYKISKRSNKNEEDIYANIFSAFFNKHPEVNNYVTKTKRFVIIDKDGKHCEKKVSKMAMYEALAVVLTEAYLDSHSKIPREK